MRIGPRLRGRLDSRSTQLRIEPLEDRRLLSINGNADLLGAASLGPAVAPAQQVASPLGQSGGEIHGTKWNDLNANGVREPGEPGLTGWIIYLDQNGNGILDQEIATTTLSDGSYAFHNLQPGDYTVAEVQQAGWQNTYPTSTSQNLIVNGGFETGNLTGWQPYFNPNPFIINDGTYDPFSSDGPLPPMSGGFSALSDVGPSTSQSLNQQLTIPAGATAILHWSDRIRNHAGAFVEWDQEFKVSVNESAPGIGEVFSTDPGDPLLQDWTRRSVDLSAYAGQTVNIGFTVTSTLGAMNVHLDDISLEINGGAGDHDVNLSAGQSIFSVDFGNIHDPQTSVIEGYKWNDVNGDGVWQLDEPALPDWRIFLDENRNGLWDAGERATDTDSQGHYIFPLLPAGTYSVAEVMQPGWEQSFPGSAMQFTDINADIEQVSWSDVAWGDYDHDGDLDLALTGKSFLVNAAAVTKIYRNDGGTFVDSGVALPGVVYGSLDWGDYDHDGDLDLALAGYDETTHTSVGAIYRNNGNSAFTDIGASLFSPVHAALQWGDYDQDNDLDLAISGAGSTYLYRNDASVFTFIDAGLLGSWEDPALDWGDYDHDNDLDLVVVGDWFDVEPHSSIKVYRNDNGVFSDASVGLPQLAGDVKWGDYDNDGDLDIAFAGEFTTAIYRNVAGAFVDIQAGLVPVWNASLDWGDYDHDGLLDLIVTGEQSDTAPQDAINVVYRNHGNGTFEQLDFDLADVANFPALAWGDYDSDGDLDLVVTGLTSTYEAVGKIYRNDAPLQHTVHLDAGQHVDDISFGNLLALGAPDLISAYDRGLSSSDNLTFLDNANPSRQLGFTIANTIPGATVTVYADGVAIGNAVAVAATTNVITFGDLDLTDGPHTITARQQVPEMPESGESPTLLLSVDTTAPTVTFNQAAGQADPALDPVINFEAVFSEPVEFFPNLSLAGTTAPGTIVASVTNPGGDRMHFNVAFTGMTGSGTVIAKVTGMAALDDAGNTNAASTSLDNVVNYIHTQILGRKLFYNQSSFDGNNINVTTTGALNDDTAIAPDKTAYVPGQGPMTMTGASFPANNPLSFRHVSNYSRGINGLMIDLAGAHPGITASDFVFKVGNNNTPSLWANAAAPTSVTVRTSGLGLASGATRVEIIWPNNSVRNTWLEVQIKANANTALLDSAQAPAGDGIGNTFFFGHRAADSGSGDVAAFLTNATDEVVARANSGAAQPITNRLDYNKDGLVSATDQILARNNPGILTFLNIASPPASPTASTSVVTTGRIEGALWEDAPSPATSDGNGVVSALYLGSGSGGRGTVAGWVANRLASVNLNSGPVARLFEHLAEKNTLGTRKALVAADNIADDLDLDHGLLDSILADLGLE